MSPDLGKLRCLRGELIKNLTALQLLEGDEAEIEAKISNVQHKIRQLDTFIFMASQPRQLAYPVDITNWTKSNEERDNSKEFIHHLKGKLVVL